MVRSYQGFQHWYMVATLVAGTDWPDVGILCPVPVCCARCRYTVSGAGMLCPVPVCCARCRYTVFGFGILSVYCVQSRYTVPDIGILCPVSVYCVLCRYTGILSPVSIFCPVSSVATQENKKQNLNSANPLPDQLPSLLIHLWVPAAKQCACRCRFIKGQSSALL